MTLRLGTLKLGKPNFPVILSLLLVVNVISMLVNTSCRLAVTGGILLMVRAVVIAVGQLTTTLRQHIN